MHFAPNGLDAPPRPLTDEQSQGTAVHSICDAPVLNGHCCKCGSRVHVQQARDAHSYDKPEQATFMGKPIVWVESLDDSDPKMWAIPATPQTVSAVMQAIANQSSEEPH